jgi:membrane protein YfhO
MKGGLAGGSTRSAPGLEASAFVAGVIVLVAFQWSALVAGTATFRHDHVYWGIPIYGFFAESVGSGRLPLWNPFTHGGEPAYAPSFQLRLLDPTAVLVAVAGQWLGADLVTLYAWDRFVRGVVIAGGCYLVLRLWARHLLTRMSLIPIVLFSSVQWSLVRQMAIAEQFLVAPFVLLFFLRIVYLRDSRWRNWLAGAFLLGLNFQSYFFSGTAILLTALAAGLLLWRRRLLGRLWRRPGLLPRLAATTAILLVMASPSVVLLSESPRFIFPPRVVDYGYEDKGPNQGPPQHEPRGEITWQRPLLFPYLLQLHLGTYSAPVDFVQMLAPFGSEYARSTGHSWGRPSEAFMYVGMLPLSVALLGLVAGRHSLKRVWTLTLVALGLLALGPQAFVHALLYWVFPPLWFARNMHTLVLFFLLALLYFYVIGCNRILGAGSGAILAAVLPAGPLARALGRPRLAQGLAAGVFGAAVMVAVLTLARVQFPLTFYTLPILACLAGLGWWLRADIGPRIFYWSILLGSSGAVALLCARRQDRTSLLFLSAFLAAPLLAWVCWTTRSSALARLGMGLALAGAMGALVHRLALFWIGGSAALGLTVGLAVALAGTVLSALTLGMASWDALRGPARIFSRGRLAAALALVSALDLVAYSSYLKPLSEGERPDRYLAGAAAQPQTFPSTRGVRPVPGRPMAYDQPVRYLDLMERRPAAFSPLLSPLDPPLPPGADAASQVDSLLQAERASTFLMTRGYYDLISSGAGGATLAEIFAIDRPLIQFRGAWMWLTEAGARALLGEASRAAELPALMRRSVVLEKPGSSALPEPPAVAPDTQGWRWTVNRYDYNSLELEVDAPARGVLYWADGYDPHWRAWVDGTEVPVHRANLAFKAIFVPPGRHAVRFEYRPTAIVVTGLLFVAMGWAGVVLGVWALASPPRLPRFAGRG